MNHVINQWNSSPTDIVCSPTVNCLNKNLTIIGIKLDILVCGSYGTCLDSTLIVWGSNHHWAGIFFCIQVI